MGYLISVAVMLLVIYIAVNVYQVIRLLIGLIMGMKVSCIRFWFLSMVRIQQRTVWGTNRFVPYIISLLLNKDNKKNQRVLHEIICSSLCFVISLAIVGYLCVEHGLMHIIYDDVLIAYIQIGQFRDAENKYSTAEKLPEIAEKYGLADGIAAAASAQ